MCTAHKEYELVGKQLAWDAFEKLQIYDICSMKQIGLHNASFARGSMDDQLHFFRVQLCLKSR